MTDIFDQPCCPGCLRVAVRVDHGPTDAATADINPGDPLPVLHVWPEGTLYDGDVYGIGEWLIRCSCGRDGIDGDAEDPIPTVRSRTPPVVMTMLGIKA